MTSSIAGNENFTRVRNYAPQLPALNVADLTTGNAAVSGSLTYAKTVVVLTVDDIAAAAPLTLTVADSNKVFVLPNVAAVPSIINLPTPVGHPGLHYEFLVSSAATGAAMIIINGTSIRGSIVDVTAASANSQSAVSGSITQLRIVAATGEATMDFLSDGTSYALLAHSTQMAGTLPLNMA